MPFPWNKPKTDIRKGDYVRFEYPPPENADWTDKNYTEVGWGLATEDSPLPGNNAKTTIRVDNLYRFGQLNLRRKADSVIRKKNQSPLNILLVGATSSGKTVFNIALHKQIRDYLPAAFTPIGGPYDKFRRNILDWVFELRKVPVSHPLLKKDRMDVSKQIYVRDIGDAGAEDLLMPPLHGELTLPGEDENTVELFMFDAGGEQYSNNRDPFFRQWVQRADAFILMVDPLRSINYRKNFPDNKFPDYGFEVPTAQDILENLIAALHDSSADSDTGGQYNHPLSVVVTKKDEPEVGDRISAISNQIRDRKKKPKTRLLKPGYDENKRALESEAVEKYIKQVLDWRNLTDNITKYFPNHSYFQVTSTGTPTIIGANEEPTWETEPKPDKVEEFLLWMRHKHENVYFGKRRWQV